MTKGLRAAGITISFGGIDVVAGVDIKLRSGEIHALVGENGAGKSSLAKAIAGVYRPRLGSLELNGVGVKFRNPREALDAGVALIHQEPITFPDLSVAENIFAGHHLRCGPFVRWSATLARSRELLESLGVALDPASPVAGLSVAARQQVELASALSHDATVWIFDETTAPLTPKEVAELFTVMRRLRDQGCALLIVTHHLQEVFAIADRITVLRDGKKVAEKTVAESNEDEIVRLMVGRELSLERHEAREAGEELLVTRGLCGPGFRDIDLTVRCGEIVGLAGLVGAGRTELARALFGITRPTAGRMLLEGQEVQVASPRTALRLGISLVPEDRLHEGLLLPQSIAVNSTLAYLARLCNGGWLHQKNIHAETNKYAARFRLACRNTDQAVSELSGGNQQKVVLAKWLMTQPKLLILDEPTRGVDVGAKSEVHRIIRELAQEGMAVLMISSDLPEVLHLSDRIAVMREGRIVAQLNGAEATEEQIMFAATGQQGAALG